VKIAAHVRNGQVVLDEPMSLRDGTKVEIVVAEQDGFDEEPDMDELDAALDESRAQIERGEYEDARSVVLRIAARM